MSEEVKACSEDLIDILGQAGFSAPQVEALKAGFPPMGINDLHTFAYARKCLDDNGVNSDHEREYAAGKVLRDAKKKNPAVVANEAEALLVLAAVELSLKKMYNNVACLGGGPLYCTMIGGEDDEKP